MAKKRAQTRHDQVKKHLIRLLQGYQLGAKLPSDRALADELGVAYLTVNRAMRDLAFEGFIERKPRRGTFLASHERAVHRDLSTGTHPQRTVVFAYPKYFSYAMWIRLQLTEEQTLKRGLAMAEFKMSRDTTLASLAELVRRTESVCGVVILPVPGVIDARAVALLDGLGVPVVVLSYSELVSAGERMWSVSTDWFRTGHLMAELMLKKGHDRLAYVHNEPDAPERHLMLKGMRQAATQAGLPRRGLAIVGGTEPWRSSRDAGYALTVKLLGRTPPTGLVYDSVAGVQGGLLAIHEGGRSAPADVSLVAEGSGGGQEDYFVPPLTTVDARPAEEVRLALDCILDGDAHTTRSLTVPPVVRSRKSIAKPAATKPTTTRRKHS